MKLYGNEIVQPYKNNNTYREDNDIYINTISTIKYRIKYDNWIDIKSVDGKCDEVIEQLTRLCTFFENMEEKNEEVVRDLSDVYLLTGEFCQVGERFSDSVEWFKKAIVVDDNYDVPYHSLSSSYLNLGETSLAIKSLEQEIQVAPGNYYSYLLLADLYEKQERYEQVTARFAKGKKKSPYDQRGDRLYEAILEGKHERE